MILRKLERGGEKKMAEKPSQQFELNKTDVGQWQRNLIKFVVPLALVYLTSVIATLSVSTNIVEFSDFVPNNIAVGAIALYALNGLYDLLNKFVSK